MGAPVSTKVLSPVVDPDLTDDFGPITLVTPAMASAEAHCA
jgi:hypothetical protein